MSKSVNHHSCATITLKYALQKIKHSCLSSGTQRLHPTHHICNFTQCVGQLIEYLHDFPPPSGRCCLCDKGVNRAVHMLIQFLKPITRYQFRNQKQSLQNKGNILNITRDSTELCTCSFNFSNPLLGTSSGIKSKHAGK